MQATEPAAHAAFDTSWLLSLAALGIMLLAAYVAFGYARHARADWRRGLAGLHFARLIGKACLALGSGIWAASVLALSSEPQVRAFEYSAWILVAAWVAAVVVAAAMLAPAARRPGALSVIGGGAVFGIGATLLQLALADSIAPAEIGIASTPIEWLLGWLAVTVGGIAGLWILFRAAGRHGSRRHVLRWAAAAVITVTLTAVQSLVLAGAVSEEVFVSSWFAVTSVLACTFAGVAVPLALLFGWMDLRQRSQARGNAGSRSSGERSDYRAATRLPR
jgi:hypothetical protein